MENDRRKAAPAMDDFLGERLVKYNQWLEAGAVDYTSRVIPVGESVKSTKWVLPTDQAAELLSKADTIALNPCLCRSHYRRCDKPLDVCLLLDGYGLKSIEKGLAHEISLEQAIDVLKQADANGLVHLSLYQPDHRLYALCSCCPCCCHDLQLLLRHHESRLVCRSDYIAVTDMTACTGCGTCIDRCPFGARTAADEGVAYDPAKCYGCGLCVTSCPAEAVRMLRA